MATSRRPASGRVRRFVVEALEPRLLYSADLGPSLLGAVVSPVAEQRLLESEPLAVLPQEAGAQTQAREVVFVDAATPDTDRLLADIAAQPGRAIDVVRIGADEDGLARISAELAARQDISAVHIVSHGSDAALYLGRSVLDLQSIEARAGELSAWSAALTSNADVLIYGCEVAETAAGRAMLERLAALTGADVAASTDPTGNRALGGDWNLEYSTSAIEAHLALSQQAQDEWFGLLAVANVGASQDTYIMFDPPSDHKNFGTSTTLIADRESTDLQRVLVQFDLGGIPANATITSATLNMQATQIGGALTIGVYQIQEGWSEGDKDGATDAASWIERVTGTPWTSAGSTVDPTAVASISTGSVGQHSWDITSLVQAWVDGSKVNNGVMIGSPDGGGDRTVTYDSRETVAGTAPVLVIDYTVNNNNAPSLDASQTPMLDAVNEDAPAPSGAVGTLVSSLVDSASPAGQVDNVTDADAGAQLGIALTGADTANGTWWYSINGGNTWDALGAVSDSGARLLAADADTRIYFQPNADFDGSIGAALTFRAWDQTAGSNGGTLDTTSNGGSTPFSSATDTAAITVNPVNDAPIGASNTVTTVEDSAFVFSAGDFGFSDADGNALLAVNITSLPAAGTLTNSGIAVAAGGFVSAADLAAGLLRFAPAAGASGAPYASFTFQVQDDGGTANGGADLDPAARTMTVIVDTLNNAPVLSGANDLATIVEDSAANGGTLVADLIAGHVSDADSGASAGIAVVGVDNTNGTWQYSLDAGASWSSFGAPSVASARLLAGDVATYVRFVPDAEWNGTVANGITFRAWDRSSGVSGGTADTTSATLSVRDEFNADSYANNDGTASWSTSWVDNNHNPATGQIRATGGELVLFTFLGNGSVYRQVDLSAASGASLSFSYDNQLSLFGAVSLQVSSNGGATYSTLATFSSVANPGSGSFSADLGAYLAFNTRIRFVINGTVLGGSFHVDNVEIAYTTPLSGGATAFSASTASSGIVVAAVNDAPSGVNNTVTTLEDTGYVFAAADFGFSDTDGNALGAVRIASLAAAGVLTNNGVALSAGQTVSAADIASGLLRFTPGSDASGAGYASFTFQVRDDGGIANGGVDLDPTARTMTVNVTAVNDAPSGANNAVTTLEDASYAFAAADFGFSDTDGNALVAVRITSLPAAGVLTNNGVAVSAGQVVSAADIAGGLLRFAPTAGANGAGYASFTFQVQDDGGTANGGLDVDAIARTMTVNVTAVNDAPSGADSTVTTLEDTAYVFAAADFGFSDADGNALAAVRIATLPGIGTLTNNGVAVSAGQRVSAADIASGLLRFTPTSNANGAGYASFTFQVQDDGGTVNGGVDLDPTVRTMTVNATAVNDAPSGTNNSVTMLEDSAYVFATADFGFGDVDGNALAGVRITAVPGAGTLINNGVAVAAGQVVSAADIASGLLRFTPAADGNGTGYASFAFQVQDDGGTANGGVNLDPTARTMTVNVTAVNDAPLGANRTVTTLEDMPYVLAAADFGFSDADGNALAAVRITALPGAGTLTNNGVAVATGQGVSAADIASGLLRFTPASDASGAGYASFNFQVQDDGGTANGGVNLDLTARTMTVNVAAVNDAPSGANNIVVLQQDGAYVFSSSDFGFSDSDGDALAGVVIRTLPPGGVITDNGAPVGAGQTVSAANIAAGLVRYTPALGASGLPYASFTFRVQDSGGTANGGVDTDAIARTMTVDVIPALSVGPGTNPVPPAPVQTQAPAPAAAAPAEDAPAFTAQNPLAAASARLLLASNDVLGTRVDVEEGFRVPVAPTQTLARDSVFATAQRSANAIPAPGPGLLAGVAGAEEAQLDFHFFGSTTVSDGAGASGSRAAGLAGDLDRMRDDMGEQADLEHWASGSMAVGSFGLTVGYVLWLLRGGALLASLLSSLPAWRLIDPLPVLSRVDDEEDLDEDDDAFVSFAQASPLIPVVPEEA